MEKKIKELIIDTMNKEEGFTFSNSYKLIEIDDDYCIFEGNISESSLNPYKIAHGGYIFGLADTCAGALACTNGKEAVTTNASVMYLKPISCKRIIAKAKFLKKGKKISNIEVEIVDEKDSLLSKVYFEFFNV